MMPSPPSHQQRHHHHSTVYATASTQSNGDAQGPHVNGSNGHNDGGHALPMSPSHNPLYEEIDTLGAELESLVEGVFSSSFYEDQIMDILMDEQDQSKHYGVYIIPNDLFDALPQYSHQLINHAEIVLSKLDEALQERARRTMRVRLEEEEHGDAIAGVNLTLKANIHARLKWIPRLPAFTRENVSGIRSTDVGTFLQVGGTVIRTGMVKILESEKTYQCTAPQCGHRFVVRTDIEQDLMQELPKQCPAPGDQRCKNTTFQLVEEDTVRTDYQEIKIQEKVQTLNVGSIPRSINVALHNDLVDLCKAGDDVSVTGTVCRRWRRIARGARCDLEVLIKANNIKVEKGYQKETVSNSALKEDFKDFWEYYKDEPLRGRNVILRSMAPQIYGLYMVKLAVALTLTGGVGHADENGPQTRGEPHLLLVGDPGTGKSQFLRFAAQLTSRSVLTTGIGSTSAGLTCTAAKDNGEWVLEAGALVLADRGICCIDEFSSIREHDRATIHEAMEQQSISIAKAGIVCKLNSRCSVLAATNPKGKYDPYEDISVNTAIATPLLSRFDIVMVLLDSSNPSWDKKVSSYILSNACIPRNDDNDYDPQEEEEDFPIDCSEQFELGVSSIGRDQRSRRIEDTGSFVTWSRMRLQAYISFVKETFKPSLTQEAQKVLMAYYSAQRQAEARSGRTTIRLLESLVRISQAHARIMARSFVSLGDALVTVSVMEVSMHSASAFGVDSVSQVDFPEDPDASFIATARDLLKRLNLEFLVAWDDMDFLMYSFFPPSDASTQDQPNFDAFGAHVPPSHAGRGETTHNHDDREQEWIPDHDIDEDFFETRRGSEDHCPTQLPAPETNERSAVTNSSSCSVSADEGIITTTHLQVAVESHYQRGGLTAGHLFTSSEVRDDTYVGGRPHDNEREQLSSSHSSIQKNKNGSDVLTERDSTSGTALTGDLDTDTTNQPCQTMEESYFADDYTWDTATANITPHLTTATITPHLPSDSISNSNGAHNSVIYGGYQAETHLGKYGHRNGDAVNASRVDATSNEHDSSRQSSTDHTDASQPQGSKVKSQRSKGIDALDEPLDLEDEEFPML